MHIYAYVYIDIYPCIGKEYQWRLVASKEGQRMKESFTKSIQISGYCYSV
jgi:hypothetical protein